MDKILVFDVWGEYAHFKKYYTTTSPLTFSIPPRTVISGLISCILGLERNEYLNYFSKDQGYISVKILAPINKVRIAENLINTKDKHFNLLKSMSHSPRIRVRFEFLKDAKYRIYFYHKDYELMEKLKDLLSKHKTFYTPYLGLSENITNFKYVGEFKIKKNESEELEIDSVIHEKLIEKINFEEGEYISERIPLEMDLKRVVTEYNNVIFERNGKKISAKVKESWRLETNEIITFL